MNKIKMIVTDMDGTLLNSNLELSAKNISAIKQAIDAGIIFAVATGRMFEAAVPYAKKLDRNIPLITYNGAVVKESQSGKILFEQTMDENISQEIFQYGKSIGLHMHGYWGGEVYTDKLDDSSRWYSMIIRKPVIEIGDDLFNIKHKTYKILGIAQPHLFRDQWNDLGYKFRGKVEITSSYPTFLEILTPGLNKWTAVKNLAQQYNIKNEEIMCIGDNHNDLSMLKNAGVGVAVANASDEVKNIVQLLVPSNDNNGVAAAIQKALQ